MRSSGQTGTAPRGAHSPRCRYKLACGLIRKHRIALIAAATFNFVLFFPTLFMGRVVSPNDVFFNYDPWASVRHVLVQNSLINDPPTSLLTVVVLMKKMTAFHWNPYIASGVPGTGSAALLSPFILIPAFAVPLSWFYTAMIFLKLNVAFFFAYLWLREERLGKRGAAIGAIIFAGAGIYSVRWLWQPTAATALYPALLWLVRRTFDGKRNSIALTSIFALVYALSGFPSTMAYGAYIAVFYGIYLAIHERRLPALRIGEGIVAIAVALLIAAPPLAAFIQFVQRTGYLGVREKLSLTVFFPLKHAMLFLRPDMLGHPAYKNWRGDPSLGMLNNYYEYTIYVGLVAIPLALLALANRRARTRWFWVGATLVVLGAMFGVGFVPAIVGRLPGFRYSPLSRSVMILPVCVAYLSASGGSLVTRWRFRTAIAAALVVLAAFDLALFAGRFYPYLPPAETKVPETPTIAFLRAQPPPFRIAAFFIDFWPNSSEMFGLEDIRSHFSSEAKYRRLLKRIDPTAWSGQSTVIQFDSRTFNLEDPLVGMLGVRYLLENKDIDIVKWSIFNRTVPGVKETGALLLPPGGVFERTIRVVQEPFWAIEVPMAAESATGKSPYVSLQLLRYGGVVFERAYTPEEIGVMSKLYVPLRPFARRGESVQLRVISHGVRGRMLSGEAPKGESPFYYGRVETPVIFDRELSDGRLFLNLAEVPRFRAAHAVAKTSDEIFLERHDLDLGSTAVVTDDSPLPRNEGGASASVSLLRYTPSEQRLATDAAAPFFLASSEKLTPELAITIDGKPAKAAEINTMFAGVQVPAGHHRVIFSRRIGRGWWWATIAGALAWIAIAGWEIWRRALRPGEQASRLHPPGVSPGG